MKALGNILRDGKLLFLLLPVGYFLLYGFDGFADTDQGFVPALAWRVVHGQVPYVDFCYVRPPLTPWLHALELMVWPRQWQMLGMRLDYYLMLWAAVLFGILALRRTFEFKPDGVSPWMLGTLAFLFSAHNFAAMPWHTVDGIFFASLGLWLLSHPRAHWQMVLGLVALGLAALAKQPFAILLPLGMALLGVLQGPRVALRVTAVALAGMLAMGACALYLCLPDGFWAAMLAQTAGASSLSELFQAGLLRYLFPGGVLAAVLAAVLWLVVRRSGMERGLPPFAWVVYGLLSLYPLALAGLAFWGNEFVPPRLGIYHLLLWGALLQAIVLWRGGNRKGAALLLMMGAISWASSLSWGYPVPALYALPGLYALHSHLTQPPWQGARTGRLVAGGLALVMVGFFLLQMYPYRDAPRWQLQGGAGEVFAPMGGIRTGQAQIDMLGEYKAWRTKYPQMAVMPAMPAADYLMGLPPVLPIDWEHDAEVGPDQMARVMAAMAQPGGAVLVELSRIGEADAPDLRYRSSLLHEVLQHWTPGPKGTYFQVYLPPTK